MNTLQLTSYTKTSDPGCGPFIESAVFSGQADWPYVLGEIYRLRQLQKTNVIVEGDVIIFRMADGVFKVSGHCVGVETC